MYRWKHAVDETELVSCSVIVKQKDMEQTPVHYSGNPGYVVGLPLVSGRRAEEYPLHTPLWWTVWMNNVT